MPMALCGSYTIHNIIDWCKHNYLKWHDAVLPTCKYCNECYVLDPGFKYGDEIINIRCEKCKDKIKNSIQSYFHKHSSVKKSKKLKCDNCGGSGISYYCDDVYGKCPECSCINCGDKRSCESCLNNNY